MKEENSTGVNDSAICVNYTAEPISAMVSTYLVPILVFIGVIGNSLILVVLNSKRKMKTRTNLLLSLMAFSDLVHAICTFLYRLPLYQSHVDVQHFYPNLQIPMLAFMRWSGMTSNWFGVSVTVERLVAIRNPLTSVTRKRSTIRLAFLIFLFSMIVCAQPIICWSGGSEKSCRGEVFYYYEQPSDALWQFYCLIWEQLSAYFYIVIPVLLMFISNAALIHFVRRHSSALHRFDSCRPLNIRNAEISSKASCSNGDYEMLIISRNNNKPSQAPRRCTHVANKPKKDTQAAVVVLALSLTSACMALPCAVAATYYFAAWLSDSLPDDSSHSWYGSYVEISNLLFLADKNIAVFIYCITSGRFRRRLWTILTCKREKRTSHFALLPLANAAVSCEGRRKS